MKTDSNIYLFGEFHGVSDNGNLSKGIELHWNNQDKTSIIDISASSESIVIVLNDGSSYALGYNSVGQLGIGSLRFCNQFTKVLLSVLLDLVVCGSTFTVWRSSSNNEIYVAGSTYGSKPQLLTCGAANSQSIKAISMSAYKQTFGLIDESGVIKLWPHFLDDDEKSIDNFVCCLLPSSPTQISCGDGFASALSNGVAYRISNDGSFVSFVTIDHHSWCYSTGLSQTSSSPPPLAATSSQLSAPINHNTASSVSSAYAYASPESVLMYSTSPKAISVKSSADYTIVLDAEGTVWLYGSIGGLKRHITSTPIARDMKSIFAMDNFCAFVNNLGVTFTMGLNDYGQLADGTRTKKTRIVEANVERPVKCVSGGKSFSVFVCCQFDSSLFEVNMGEFIPGHINCPFEKTEDMIDAQTTP